MPTTPAPDALKTLAAALAEANGRITQMHAQMIDYFDDYYRVVDDECAPDEKHCTCVPHLRRRIAELEAQLAAVPRWTRITEDPTTWPPVNFGYVLSIAPNGYDLTPSSLLRKVPEMYTWWLPITPPEPQL